MWHASKLIAPVQRRLFPMMSRHPAVVVSNMAARCCSTVNSSPADVEEPVDDVFRLFSLPLTFKINEDELRFRYREIMKDLHPDKLRHESREHQLQFEQQASVVTHAYDVLKRPHLRAAHLLSILTGAPSDKEIADDDAQPPQELLMLVMELGEMIESACTDAELKPYFDANQKRILDTCQKLERAFEDSDLKRAGELATELKYWNRIDETLRGKMDSLE